MRVSRETGVSHGIWFNPFNAELSQKRKRKEKKKKKEEKEAAIPEGGGGKEARLHLTLLCHHQNGFRLKDGQR